MMASKSHLMSSDRRYPRVREAYCLSGPVRRIRVSCQLATNACRTLEFISRTRTIDFASAHCANPTHPHRTRNVGFAAEQTCGKIANAGAAADPTYGPNVHTTW